MLIIFTSGPDQTDHLTRGPFPAQEGYPLMADTGSPQGQAYAGHPYPKGTEAYLNAVPVRVIVVGANGHYLVTDQAGVNHQAHHSELGGAVVPSTRWTPSWPCWAGRARCCGLGCCVTL